MASASEIVIEEVTGKRTARLRLRGSGLPFKGAAWPSELRVVTTRYPGNPDEGTQQVLGPLDAPTEWQGFWRRTLLGRVPCAYSEGGGAEQSVRDPDALWTIVESLMRGAARLRVTWTATRPWDRTTFVRVLEGRIVKFTPAPETIGDIGWEMGFDWASRGGTAPKVADAQSPASNAGADDLARYFAQLEQENVLNTPIDRTSTAPGGSSYDALGQLERLVNAPQELVASFFRAGRRVTSDLKRVGDLAKSVRGMPAGLADQAVAFALNTRDMVDQFQDDMGRTAPEQTTLDQRASDLVRGHGRYARLVDGSRPIARTAVIIAQQAMRPRSTTEASASTREPGPEGQIIALHTVSEGDTAQSISKRYYRTPDNAAAILRANGLPWHLVRVARGTILQIPVLRGGESG